MHIKKPSWTKRQMYYFFNQIPKNDPDFRAWLNEPTPKQLEQQNLLIKSLKESSAKK